MNEIRDRRDKHWFWIDDAVIDAHATALGSFGLALYMVLARHADRHGQCYPSLRRLQELMGDASRNTIKKYLALLVSRGLIAWTPRLDEDGNPSSHLYTLLPIPTSPDASAGGRSTIDPGVSTIDRGGSTIDGGVGQPLTGGRSTIDPEGIGFKELDFEGGNSPLTPMNGGTKHFDPQSREQNADTIGEHNVFSSDESSITSTPEAPPPEPALDTLQGRPSRADGTNPRALEQQRADAAQHQVEEAMAQCPYCDVHGWITFFDAHQTRWDARCPHDLPKILAYVASHAYTWPGAPPGLGEGGPAPPTAGCFSMGDDAARDTAATSPVHEPSVASVPSGATKGSRTHGPHAAAVGRRQGARAAREACPYCDPDGQLTVYDGAEVRWLLQCPHELAQVVQAVQAQGYTWPGEAAARARATDHGPAP
jgi:hypothetical protein